MGVTNLKTLPCVSNLNILSLCSGLGKLSLLFSPRSKKIWERTNNVNSGCTKKEKLMCRGQNDWLLSVTSESHAMHVSNFAYLQPFSFLQPLSLFQQYSPSCTWNCASILQSDTVSDLSRIVIMSGP